MKKVVVRIRKKVFVSRLMWLLLFLLAFGLLMVVDGLGDKSSAIIPARMIFLFMLWFGFGTFLFAALRSLRDIFRTEPLLVLDEKGLFDGVNSKKLIGWDLIERVDVVEIDTTTSYKPFVRVKPKKYLCVKFRSSVSNKHSQSLWRWSSLIFDSTKNSHQILIRLGEFEPNEDVVVSYIRKKIKT